MAFLFSIRFLIARVIFCVRMELGFGHYIFRGCGCHKPYKLTRNFFKCRGGFLKEYFLLTFATQSIT
ncbi:hypothetical protein KC19_7G023300 [Ceratodon purpureus]|uniref:Secreted protein n=1 Tax=Ceratodon purpureus TaxID=3225 RepID=A0A8T0H580_CERPU|nr:hypothetical protein KC19_7G023300 [Ceratodon purpureus]